MERQGPARTFAPESGREAAPTVSPYAPRMASMLAIPPNERPAEAPPESKPPRVLTEEERKKRVDAAADAFMTDNAEIFRDLAK